MSPHIAFIPMSKAEKAEFAAALATITMLVKRYLADRVKS